MIRFRGRDRRRGLTLIECTVALTVFSIVSLGAAVGMQGVAKGPAVVEMRLWSSQQLTSKMEVLRDTAYASLASGTGTSDADYNGRTYTITWTVTEIDPASPTSSPPVAKASSGLKQVAVTMNGQTVTTWVSQ